MDVDDIAVDVHHDGDGHGRASADQKVTARDDRVRAVGLVDEPPGQPGLAHPVQATTST